MPVMRLPATFDQRLQAAHFLQELPFYILRFDPGLFLLPVWRKAETISFNEPLSTYCPGDLFMMCVC